MRYFFHFVSGGDCYEDSMGDQFESLEEVLAYAHRLARNLGAAGSNLDGPLDQAVLVVDAKGQEVALVRIDTQRNDIGGDPI